jgi:hypothetical protein
MSKEHLAFIGVEVIVRVLLMVCVCNSRSKENHRGGLAQRFSSLAAEGSPVQLRVSQHGTSAHLSLLTIHCPLDGTRRKDAAPEVTVTVASTFATGSIRPLSSALNQKAPA